MEMERNKSAATCVSAAAAAMALVQMSHGGVTPALAVIGASFANTSEITLALLNTMPVLTSIPATFISGKLAGRKLSFRNMMLAGLALLLAGGFSAFFCKSIGTVLLCRAVFGVGLGISSHAASTFTLCIFSEEKANKQLALNSLSANLGSVLFQLAGGYLCLFGWQYTFLCYLIILIPLCTVCLTVNPSYEGEKAEEPQKEESIKISLNIGRTGFWCGVIFLYYIGFYVFVNNMSQVIVGNGYGTSADVALVLSVFNLGGLGGGALYRSCLFKLEAYVFLPSLLLCAAGFGCVLPAENLMALYGAAVLFGCGFGIFMPAGLFYGGTSAEASQRSSMVSYLNIANNLGGFSSAYVLSAVSALLGLKGNMTHFYLGLGIFGLLAVVLLAEAVRRTRSKAV